MKTMMGWWEIQNLFLLSFHLAVASLVHSELWVNLHPTRQPKYSSVFTINFTSTNDCCLSPLEAQDNACRKFIKKLTLNNFQQLL